MPIRMPSSVIAMALMIEPLESETETSKPSTISEKYSAAPKLRATLASGGASSAMTSVAMVPAMKEAIAAVASAAPARP